MADQNIERSFRDALLSSLKLLGSGAVAATVCLALTACGSSSSSTHSSGAASTAHLKVGLVLDGSINDGGYDESAYKSLRAAMATVGANKFSLTYAQNTPYTTQMTQVVNGMIADGAKLIIDIAGGATLVYNVCAKSPDVQCLEVNGLPPLGRNVQAFYPKNWLTDYLVGVAAGLLTKTGKIGYAAAFKIPSPIFESINAVALGCQSVRPDCKVLVSYVNSWYDPPTETNIFNTLVGAGADVLVSYTNDAVAVQVAKKNHIWGFGIFGDQSSFGPHAYVTSRLVNWSYVFEKYIRAGLAGHVSGGGVDLMGLGPELHLSAFGKNVPASVVAKVQRDYAALKAGKNPFVGPIYDQSGAVRVAKGIVLTDAFIYGKWNWLVKGVVGSG